MLKQLFATGCLVAAVLGPFHTVAQAQQVRTPTRAPISTQVPSRALEATPQPNSPGDRFQQLNPGSSEFTCEGLACTCSGDDDCNDMFTSNVCGDLAYCDADTGECHCLRF